MTGIRKSFPGVQAIKDASFDVRAGEIHALVGENGAGKSTLIKILTGAHKADFGEISILGQKIIFDSPIAAQKAGIVAIYQEFTLVPSLPVHSNLFLGREKVRHGFIDSKSEKEQARAIFERLGVEIDPETLISELSVASQQLVEIARALVTEPRILVMDEPTAALTPREVESLFGILGDLKAQGIGIIFIGHRLDEILRIADKITVMRDGLIVGTWNKEEIDKSRLIVQMVGRSLEEEYPRDRPPVGDIILRIRNLSGGPINNVSFDVRRGEVLGLSGLMGAGRTEVARLIFGADKKESGDIILNGKTLKIKSPESAADQGICLLTEDRKGQGLILRASARDNFSLPSLKKWSQLGFIDRRTESSRFAARVENLNIRLSGPDQLAEDLSGGNQQKLLVARWLETAFEVIIFDEPTRGIDVGAKYEMYLLINDLASSGKAVIMISSDLPEVLGISDRILVMREGKISGEIRNVSAATQEDIMALAV